MQRQTMFAFVYDYVSILRCVTARNTFRELTCYVDELWIDCCGVGTCSLVKFQYIRLILMVLELSSMPAPTQAT